MENIIKVQLNKVEQNDPESHREIKKDLDDEMRDARSERGKLFVQIRFLFVRFAFNVSMLKNRYLDLLPPDYEIPKPKPFSEGSRAHAELGSVPKKREVIPNRVKIGIKPLIIIHTRMLITTGNVVKKTLFYFIQIRLINSAKSMYLSKT